MVSALAGNRYGFMIQVWMLICLSKENQDYYVHSSDLGIVNKVKRILD